MNFVVNFANIGKAQTPSKLIDYVILKKAILNIKSGKLNKNVVYEFLQGNYKNKLEIKSPDQYRIENVAQQFIILH